MHAVLTRILLTVLTIFTFALPAAASSQERSAIRQDFSLPADGSARILVLRPSITVGAQSTGGMFEPNADWTEQSRQNLGAALASAQLTLGNRVVEMVEPVGDQTQIVRDYSTLFTVVAQSVITYQFFVGNRLETKKRDNRDGRFEWTLGPGVASLPGADQADYALFITTRDAFGSTGRKIFQVLAAASVGISVKSGEHWGYAGLVDLRTGDLVWINADNEMGGDVRTPEGAARRVSQLLEDFPGRPAPAAGAN